MATKQSSVKGGVRRSKSGIISRVKAHKRSIILGATALGAIGAGALISKNALSKKVQQKAPELSKNPHPVVESEEIEKPLKDPLEGLGRQDVDRSAVQTPKQNKKVKPNAKPKEAKTDEDGKVHIQPPKGPAGEGVDRTDPLQVFKDKLARRYKELENRSTPEAKEEKGLIEKAFEDLKKPLTPPNVVQGINDVVVNPDKHKEKRIRELNIKKDIKESFTWTGSNRLAQKTKKDKIKTRRTFKE